MNIIDPWNLLFFIGLISYFNIRRIFVTRLKLVQQTKAVRRFDRQEKLLLFAMGVAVLLLPILYLFTPLFNFANYNLPIAVRALGMAVMIASLWLFWRSHADLAENWSVTLEVREEHQLVTTGVYAKVRHPMYASIWLWALAQGMMLENWLVGWSTAVAFAAMYFLRTPREEQLMLDTFGDDYRHYMRKTGRLVPRMFLAANETNT